MKCYHISHWCTTQRPQDCNLPGNLVYKELCPSLHHPTIGDYASIRNKYKLNMLLQGLFKVVYVGCVLALGVQVGPDQMVLHIVEDDLQKRNTPIPEPAWLTVSTSHEDQSILATSLQPSTLDPLDNDSTRRHRSADDSVIHATNEHNKLLL